MKLILPVFFLILMTLASFATDLKTQLDLRQCLAGDQISMRTHSGQGVDSLEVTKKIEPDLCEIRYRSELEGGYKTSLCRFHQKMGLLSFQNFSIESCEPFKSGNSHEEFAKEMAEKRKNSCGNFTASNCPASRCLVMKDCQGHQFCGDIRPNDTSKCGVAGYSGQRVECCPGLKPICPGIMIFLDANQPHQYEVPMCLACGNKICDPLETKANCPQDCK